MRISDWSSDVCSSDLQLLDHIDVRSFQRPLRQRAKAVQARRAGLRRAAGGGFEVEVFTACLQAGRIDEIGKLQGTDLLRRGLSGDTQAYPPLPSDGDALGVGRSRQSLV